MNQTPDSCIRERIRAALEAAKIALAPFTPGAVKTEFKFGDDPVTEADRTVDRVLREFLLRDGEGWLSEESADDLTRLDRERVWIVDPLDGTREFVTGIPEWCISVGLIEHRKPIAGGICNPVTGEIFLGSVGGGVTYNGRPAQASLREMLCGATVLASRSEVKRGEWQRFEGACFSTRPMGSVAYKLALVSVGLADATFTLCPKNEWDIAAGVALVEAAGGFAQGLDNAALVFNNESPLLPGLVAGGKRLRTELTTVLAAHSDSRPVEVRAQ